MSLGLAILALIAGIVLLSKCADFLVTGAVSLARLYGISPLVIGLTIVAMGTSAPEVAASIAAVFTGPEGGDIAIGNVFGSNIANLALVGGIVTLMRPLRIQTKILKKDIPIMMGVCLVLWPLLRNGSLARPEGLLLLLLFVMITAWTVYGAVRPATIKIIELPEETGPPAAEMALSKSLLFIVLGLIGLAVGAKLAVYGAVVLGEWMGLSKAVIGLTIIAIGTSLPELVTCIVAGLKGHHDLSVGNLVGSNIFNTLLVTGVSGTLKPFTVSPRFAGGEDYWAMIGVGFVFLGLGLLGKGMMSKKSGLVLGIGYIIYLWYTIRLTA